jgi:cobalt-precorrin 5A hydrolase
MSVVVAGVGCRRDCAAADIVAIVERAEHMSGLRVTMIATPARKSGELGLRDAAARLGRPLRFIDDAAMAATQRDCVTFSDTVRRHAGVASVAEAAALAAAGEGATLVLPRISAASVTCAMAAGR